MLLNVALVAQYDKFASDLLLGQVAVFAGVQKDCVVGLDGRPTVRSTFTFLLASPGYSGTLGQERESTNPVLKTSSTHGTTSTC